MFPKSNFENNIFPHAGPKNSLIPIHQLHSTRIKPKKKKKNQITFIQDQEIVSSNPGTMYWMDVSDLLAITIKEI